jgi:hypothetical protein
VDESARNQARKPCKSPPSAEGEGFEPSVDRKAHNGFRDRPVQPLRHPSGRLILGGRAESGPPDAVCGSSRGGCITEASVTIDNSPPEGFPGCCSATFAAGRHGQRAASRRRAGVNEWSAARSKKGAQQVRRFLRQEAARDRRPVVQARLSEHVEHASGGTRLGVVRPEHEPWHAR